MDVAVVGGIGRDLSVRGARLPGEGESAQGDEYFAGPGGKGSNAAVAAVRLGARAALIGAVGDDTEGDTLLSRLRDEGVHVHHVVRCRRESTAVTLIHVDQDGRKQTMSRPGANHCLAPTDVRAAAATIRAARLLLVQLEVPLPSVLEAVRIAREAGVPIVLDPAPVRPLPDELLQYVDVIRLNAGEAEVLSGVAVCDRDTARRAAECLLHRGVGAVVVQASDAGNLLVRPDGEHWLPRHEVDTVDTTGAGDAFSAALAVGLADGSSLEEACDLASSVAALATTALGAQTALPTVAAARKLLGGTQETAAQD